jgi:beta-aspartyl-peptidase (threonine type)
MDGRSRAAGGVAAVMHIKNPISGARAVMEYSQHVLLAGVNAEHFCKKQQIELADHNYFITANRKKQLQQMQAEGHALDLDSLGTVGAVACDSYGNLAAATSTGGKANKIPGRVGDSPIIGAGVWADNKTCAISATGDGEIFIRSVFAHEIAALITYKNLDLKSACEAALQQVAALGGEGGCIAIDKNGEVVMAFNTPGMYRAWINHEGVAEASIAAL